jgi:hypothetical protein
VCFGFMQGTHRPVPSSTRRSRFLTIPSVRGRTEETLLFDSQCWGKSEGFGGIIRGQMCWLPANQCRLPADQREHPHSDGFGFGVNRSGTGPAELAMLFKSSLRWRGSG